MTQDSFISFLSKLTKNDLLGFESHKKMFPNEVTISQRQYTSNSNAKQSSVLILLNQNINSSYDIIFTLRSSKLKNHSGQISFPGGRNEINETPLETAKRETYEEIGLKYNDYQILTELSQLYVPPSNSIINPVVAYTEKNLNFYTNPDEVEEVIIRDFQLFLDNSNLKYSKKLFTGQKFELPYWDINYKTPLWGATAIILQELIDLYFEHKKSGI